MSTNSNRFLGTERIGKLMKQYAVPRIISLGAAMAAINNMIECTLSNPRNL